MVLCGVIRGERSEADTPTVDSARCGLDRASPVILKRACHSSVSPRGCSLVGALGCSLACSLVCSAALLFAPRLGSLDCSLVRSLVGALGCSLACTLVCSAALLFAPRLGSLDCSLVRSLVCFSLSGLCRQPLRAPSHHPIAPHWCPSPLCLFQTPRWLCWNKRRCCCRSHGAARCADVSSAPPVTVYSCSLSTPFLSHPTPRPASPHPPLARPPLFHRPAPPARGNFGGFAGRSLAGQALR